MIEDLSGFVGNYDKITTLDGLKKLVDILQKQNKPVTFDVETGYSGPDRAQGSLEVYNPNQFIAGFALTNAVNWARYVPVLHDFGDNLDPEQTWTIVKPLLESVSVNAHNFGFESRNCRMLDKKGHGPRIDLEKGGFEDTMLQSYSLSETQYHGLKPSSKIHYNYEQAEIDSLFDNLKVNKKSMIRFNPLSIDDPRVINYVCDDVTWTHRLNKDRLPKVLAERKFIYNLEKEICLILVEMAEVGLSVDWDGIKLGLQQYDYFYDQMENLTRKMFAESTGRDMSLVNFRSHPQVRKLLFDPDEGLGLKAAQKTKKGGLDSTGDTSLEALRHEHPAVEQLLKYRQTKKMGEWFELWSGLQGASFDEKVHPNFKQTTVQSGRFACDMPNVQNIRKKWWFTAVPRDTEKFPNTKEGDASFEFNLKAAGKNGVEYWSGNARDYIVASPGYRLLSFDYGQQELRVLAGLAKEPYLIKAFENGEDIHKATAALMFGLKLEDVTDEHRQKGKTINFGNVYGQGPKAMGDQLGITTNEAKELFNRYFAAFTNVATWFEAVKAKGRQTGYVESFLGRKSTIWEYQSNYEVIRNKADRLFVNVPVQGGGADITKVAMVRARRMLIDKGWWMTKVRLLMNQHDSLVFEVADDLDLEEVKNLLEPQVSFPVAGFPKFVVDWESGLRWGSCQKWEDGPMQVKVLDQEIVKEVVPLDGVLTIVFSDKPSGVIISAIADILKDNEGDSLVKLVIEDREAVLRSKVEITESLCSQLRTVSNGSCEVKILEEV